MKKAIKQTARVLMLSSAVLLSSSCEDESEDNFDLQTVSVATVNSVLATDAAYSISSFIEDGADYTIRFSDYSFRFGGNQDVQAASINDTITGTYRIFVDDGKTELSMSFSRPSSFFELNDDWYIITANEQVLECRDGSDQLIFERI